MECTYRIREDIGYTETGRRIPVYGIEAVTPCGAVLCAVPDVFTDKTRAVTLAHRCNAAALAPMHLPEVVEDVLV